MFGYKGIRMIIIVISYTLICFVPDSSATFFKSLFVFASGLACDYYIVILSSDSKFQKGIGILGISTSALFVIISFCGLMNCIEIAKTVNNIVLRNVNSFKTIPLNIGYVSFTRLIGILPICTLLEIANEIKRPFDVKKSSSEQKKAA